VSEAASSVASAASSKVSSAASAVSSAVAGATGPAVVGTTTGTLGTFLVDGKGMTLYMYVPDTAGVSTCYDKCAAAWPPLLTSGAPTASGSADKSKLSTSARTDGSTMVNYGAWPLYYFAKDKAPGDTTGQGVQDVWYVVGVDGQPIKTPAS
jgi:predicted lipoprotein with Yx(FWY)xxD motif